MLYNRYQNYIRSILLTQLVQKKQMIPVTQNKTLSPLFSSTLTFSDKNPQGSSTCEPSFSDHPQPQDLPLSLHIHTEPAPSDYSQHSLRNDSWHPNPKPRHSQPLPSPEQGYEAIETILKNENHNLKQQNQFLLQEVYRLKSANRKYKDHYRIKKLQLEEIRAECKVHQNRADELKDIVMDRLSALQRKVQGKSLSSSECSLLEILNQATEDQSE